MMNITPWWASGFLPGAIILLNFGLMALLLGGYIFLLIKVASIDKTLKKMEEKMNNRL